jgi:hypothetical protein
VSEASGDPIGEYLAELRAGLRTPPARTAEILAEAEDHLRESAAAARRAGHLSEAAAQRAAVEAFGPAKAVTRAHRPRATAFAAAAGLKAWPLLAAYLLLSAVAGALLLCGEVVTSGHAFTRATATDLLRGDRKITIFTLTGAPHLAQAVAVFGGCALAGGLLVAGLLFVRPRSRRSGLALLRLPRGLVPLAAAIGLIALGVAGYQLLSDFELGWLPRLTGSYELVEGGTCAAVLTGVGCAMWALANVLSDPAEARPAGRAGRPPASAYIAEVSLKAGQLLGGYLLLSALLGGLLLFVDVASSPLTIAAPGEVAAAFGGCVLAGVVLIAGFAIPRRRRRQSDSAPARPPRGVFLLASVIALLALAFAEYKFFAGDVMGTLHEPDGISDLILGSQWAAVLLGAGWALRTLVFLVRWAASGGRGTRKATPPGNNPDLAAAG